MFGYIVVNQAELKYKEYEEYHKYYCGLCKSLKENYGISGQVSLSFDMTFLVVLLTSLYEPVDFRGERNCIAHPLSKHPFITNKFTDYVADMNAILTYYKCLDDWKDDKKLFKKLYSMTIFSGKRKKKKLNKEKIEVIERGLKEIHKLENENSDDLDLISHHFGTIMGEICTPFHDEWEEDLRGLGYYLGKFIYILDAYDDIEKDLKKKNYNPFISKLNGTTDMKEYTGLSDFVRAALSMTIAECARHFEMLPLVLNVEILRNIIYSGVWNAYFSVTQKRHLQQEKNQEKKVD